MNKPAWVGKRRDENEVDIVRDLKKCGFGVWRLSDPCDLLVWPKSGGQFGVIEVKNPEQPPSKRQLTDVEQRFFDATPGCPRVKVETIDEALAFAQTLKGIA